GGPLASGYYFFRDFRALSEPRRATYALAAAVIVTILLLGGVVLIPALERIPNMVFPVVYSSIAYGVFRSSLSEKVSAHIVSGGSQFGWGNTIGVSVLFLVVTLIPIFS